MIVYHNVEQFIYSVSACVAVTLSRKSRKIHTRCGVPSVTAPLRSTMTDHLWLHPSIFSITSSRELDTLLDVLLDVLLDAAPTKQTTPTKKTAIPSVSKTCVVMASCLL